MKKQSNKVCYQCGSPLLELDKAITFLQNTQSAITTTTFRCSNEACQEKIDRKMTEMTNQRLDREKREVAKAVVVAENRAKAKEAKLQLLEDAAKITSSK